MKFACQSPLLNQKSIMKKLIIVALAFTMFVSCDKDKDTCNQDMAGISATYRITAVTYRQTPTGPEIDYYTTFFPDACDRDDFITLNANGTYTYTDAGTVCSPDNNRTGTWSVSGNTITVDGEAGTILSFDCDFLVFGQNDIFVANDQLKLTMARQ